MRSTSLPGFDLAGFDLREAVSGLRDAFESRVTKHTGSAHEGHRDIRSAILTELAVEPMHGYQLIQAIEVRSGGAWTPSAGSVYPTLQLLADEELVTAKQVGERKVYTLTDAGIAAAAQLTEPAPTSETPRERDRAIALAKSSAKLAQAVAQFPGASSDQSDRAVALIDETRRKLYAILAED